MYSSTFPDFQSHLHKYTLRNTPVNFLSLAFTYFYSAISWIESQIQSLDIELIGDCTSQKMVILFVCLILISKEIPLAICVILAIRHLPTLTFSLTFFEVAY